MEVQGDFALYQQMAYNLILNACQALAEDKDNTKPSLSITTSRISEDRVCLKIKDNGIGIAQGNLEKIFQPLWTSRKKGTGFGLGLTKQFIKKYGGEIFVSSREKEFTCFTVLLPLYRSDLSIDKVS